MPFKTEKNVEAAFLVWWLVQRFKQEAYGYVTIQPIRPNNISLSHSGISKAYAVCPAFAKQAAKSDHSEHFSTFTQMVHSAIPVLQVFTTDTAKSNTF